MTNTATATYNTMTDAQETAYFEFCEKHDLDVMMDFDEQVQYLRDIEQKSLAIRLKRIILRDNAPKESASPKRSFKDNLIAMLPVVAVVKRTASLYKTCREAESLKTAKKTPSGLQLGMGF
jgi:hypothetical protein